AASRHQEPGVEGGPRPRPVGGRRNRSALRHGAAGLRGPAQKGRAVQGNASDRGSPGAAARDRARGPRRGARCLWRGHLRSRAHTGAARGRMSAEGKEITQMRTTARFLMCRPDHFAVDYAINPWMNPQSWARESEILVDASRREWTALHRTLSGIGAAIELVPPLPHLPDLVFTANAAVVLDRKAVLSRFRYPE